MANTKGWLLGLSALLIGGVALIASGTMAAGGGDCCSAKSNDALVTKLDSTIESWKGISADFGSLSKDASAQLEQASAVLKESSPAFALVPATLTTVSRLLDAADSKTAVAATTEGSECPLTAGEAKASPGRHRMLTMRTAELLNVSLRSASAMSASHAKPASCGASATSDSTATVAVAGGAMMAKGSCCASAGAVATASTETLLAEADQLIGRWKEAASAFERMTPESKEKIGQAICVGTTTCPIGKRMVATFAVAREALAEASASEDTSLEVRTALVRKARELVDLTGSAFGLEKAGCCAGGEKPKGCCEGAKADPH